MEGGAAAGSANPAPDRHVNHNQGPFGAPLSLSARGALDSVPSAPYTRARGSETARDLRQGRRVRVLLESRGTIAVIPNKSNRKRIFPFDSERYKWRNVIERTNCRLKDFRAIATRYDKLARNFLAGLCLVTALLYWCD